MPSRITKAELEAKVDYWQKRCCELSSNKGKEFEDLQRQVVELRSEAREATDKLRSITNAWNQWVVADKNLKEELATIRFPHEAFERLLYLLKP